MEWRPDLAGSDISRLSTGALGLPFFFAVGRLWPSWGLVPGGRVTLEPGCFGLMPSRFLSALTALVSPFPGEFLSLVWPRERNQREGHPDIRVALCATSLTPVPLRGPAYKVLPWTFKPLAASLRLVPLRNTSTRPPDGDPTPSCLNAQLAALRLLALNRPGFRGGLNS